MLSRFEEVNSEKMKLERRLKCMEEDIEGMNYHHIEAEQQMERMIEDKIEIIDRLSF